MSQLRIHTVETMFPSASIISQSKKVELKASNSNKFDYYSTISLQIWCGSMIVADIGTGIQVWKDEREVHMAKVG